MGKKLFVVEARRLLPLLFLLVLLVSLSVYDSFRASPTINPEEVAARNEVSFTTADKGERKEQPTFRLAADEEAWANVAEEWSIQLPQYPFQPQHEMALFALHAEVKNVKANPRGEGEMEVEVQVNPKRDFFQVVTVPAADVVLDAGETTWTFVDKKGNILEQFTAGDATETGAEEAPQK
ncbi:hypothetical protein [Dethiobacter alkaliphilus]|uniref:hypothetical protein n=1 Tax=Dethiobacter alkaliphilus TaxID=427926 RepID=UPI0022263311|nr:hypothetical protein [Dethiobacter alkaliphilus]MCW3489330.1 hypothetical protein [Dethiobacter alkaliphilus]